MIKKYFLENNTYHVESESESEVAQLCPTLRDPMDSSPPGSSVHGICQARVLEWGAIAFSDSNGLKMIQYVIFLVVFGQLPSVMTLT